MPLISDIVPEVRTRLNTTNRGLLYRALLPLTVFASTLAFNLI